jgi:hypothetical protein
MKMISKYITCAMVMVTIAAGAQSDVESTGLPGDNFSLAGALELFKKSESPEAFEKMLNEEENKVNNLDLNEDGQTDYIRVIDKQEGDVHAFVLQAAISETENQDVAVIEVEKDKDDKASVQIVGDEDIYGEQTIIEPTEQVKSHAGTQTSNVVVNVYTWPAVRYVYRPAYRVWVSPWGWYSRPVWWRPWRPVHYHVYHGYHHHHHPHYVVVHHHRTVHAHRIYRPVRTTSVTVTTRHRESVNRYGSENTRSTRTRTTTVNAPERNERVTREHSRSSAPAVTTPKSEVTRDRSRSSSPTVTTPESKVIRERSRSSSPTVTTPQRTERTKITRQKTEQNNAPSRQSNSSRKMGTAKQTREKGKS